MGTNPGAVHKCLTFIYIIKYMKPALVLILYARHRERTIKR